MPSLRIRGERRRIAHRFGRLVGVAASRIETGAPAQLSLLPEDPRRRRLNRVVDQVRERFGSDSLARAEDAPVERAGLTEQIKAGEDAP